MGYAEREEIVVWLRWPSIRAADLDRRHLGRAQAGRQGVGQCAPLHPRRPERLRE